MTFNNPSARVAKISLRQGLAILLALKGLLIFQSDKDGWEAVPLSGPRRPKAA